MRAGTPSRAWTVPALAIAGGLLASGCGGGAEQNAHETNGTFDVAVVRASFPARQAIAKPSTLEVWVRNTGTHTMPNVAVALNSLQYTEDFPQLAANQRPVWAIEQGPGAAADPPVQSEEVSKPGNGQTAYVNTWALGPLAPGSTRAFRWQLMPVKAGFHVVNFAVYAGLAGKAKAQLSSGAPAAGSFPVVIAPAPPIRHVQPSTGAIAPGPYPPPPYPTPHP